MNTKNLAKRYDQLNAHERYLLILAAAARVDVVEQHRLLDSAPSIVLQAPNHYWLGAALDEAAHFHMKTLLDLAVKYLRGWGLWGWHYVGCRVDTAQDHGVVGGKGNSAAEDTQASRLCHIARYYAFLFLIYFDGWKQFCAELPIDAELLLDVMPGWEMVPQTEEEVRELAVSRDDVVNFFVCEAFAAQGADCEELELPRLPTVAELAKEWHGFVNRRVKALSGSR